MPEIKCKHEWDYIRVNSVYKPENRTCRHCGLKQFKAARTLFTCKWYDEGFENNIDKNVE